MTLWTLDYVSWELPSSLSELSDSEAMDAVRSIQRDRFRLAEQTEERIKGFVVATAACDKSSFLIDFKNLTSLRIGVSESSIEWRVQNTLDSDYREMACNPEDIEVQFLIDGSRRNWQRARIMQAMIGRPIIHFCASLESITIHYLGGVPISFYQSRRVETNERVLYWEEDSE